MLAVVCSMLANTSADSEGKQFVYRKGTSGQSSGIAVLPDPSMMRPEDFLPIFGGAVVEVDDHPMLRHQKAGAADPAEPLLAYLKDRMGAVDLRKPVRSAPRPT